MPRSRPRVLHPDAWTRGGIQFWFIRALAGLLFAATTLGMLNGIQAVAPIFPWMPGTSSGAWPSVVYFGGAACLFPVALYAGLLTSERIEWQSGTDELRVRHLGRWKSVPLAQVDALELHSAGHYQAWTDALVLRAGTMRIRVAIGLFPKPQRNAFCRSILERTNAGPMRSSFGELTIADFQGGWFPPFFFGLFRRMNPPR